MAFQIEAEYLKEHKKDYEDMYYELNHAAIDFFLYALKIDENLVNSRFHLGVAYHRLQKYQEALNQLSKALLLNPDDKQIHIMQGIVYQDMKDNRMAINDFNEAIAIDPQCTEGYFRRGVSKFYMHNNNDAIDDLNTAEIMLKEETNFSESNNLLPCIHDALGSCYHAL